MNTWLKSATGALALLVASTAMASATPPSAQDGWLAWQGCWRADGDAPDVMLCIVPQGDGARMINVVAGNIQSENRLASNAMHVEREGCRGTETARWSGDGRRLFTRSEMTCGENTTRRVTGIMAMLSPTDWLSVQAVTSGNQTIARTKRYHAVEQRNVPQAVAALVNANSLAAETARYAASAPLELSDVAEAVHNVDTQVVTDWLVATDQRFDLTGRKLVSLANSGVPAEVIDVLVAVSNPEHFAVKTVADRDEGYRRSPRGGGYDPCYDYYDPWYGTVGYGYGYRYGGRYYYDRCGIGYSPWGYDPWGWRYPGTVVIVRDGGAAEPGAKVTKKGYSGGRSSGTAHPRDGSTTGTATARSTGSSSGSSTGRTSSGGSSTSSGTSTGRTAHPKDK